MFIDDAGIPTETDWRSEPWGIDTPYAYDHFFGKDRAAAFSLFVENALCYEEDVMFMPAVCFRYYVHAYMDYLLSDESAGDSDAANAFFGLVGCRRDDIRGSDVDVESRVVAVLRHLRQRQEWFGADPEVYGDFTVRADEAIALFESNHPR